MQIDFHHAVTYVAARRAGFSHDDAEIIAYAAQYVDDCTSSGTIMFDNMALYSRISSSYKAIDVAHNLNPLKDLLVWMPFHFLPGNGGQGAGRNPSGTFIQKLVTIPDSPVAEAMIQAAIEDKAKPYSLHRLGITMHVYADTWAHEGFAGVIHPINEVDDCEETGDSGVFSSGLKNILGKVVEHAAPPLGHGKANVFPDVPFLSWRYVNGRGESKVHNNTERFTQAADSLCKAMQRYLGKEETGMGNRDLETVQGLFTELKYSDGEDRHAEWIEAIGEGRFSFGPAAISYAEDGHGSWKAEALGSSRDRDRYPYRDAFLTSNWKLFHDALQLHRLTVCHDILPQFGICAP